MILFWLICAGLVAIALAFVLPTLLQGASTSAATGTEEANLEVYRDQLSELDADLANGIVSPEQYQQDREEIERRLLEDVPPAKAELRHLGWKFWLKPLAWSLASLAVVSFILPRLGFQHWLIKAIPGTQPALGVSLIHVGRFYPRRTIKSHYRSGVSAGATHHGGCVLPNRRQFARL